MYSVVVRRFRRWLGVAAERVFDLVCRSLLAALSSEKEKKALEAHLARARIKPRLEYIHRKLLNLQDSRIDGFPESAPLMVTAMYDMIRAQRNDLGHPRELPPQVDRQEAHARLQIFGAYYEVAEQRRAFLSGRQV